MKPLLPIQVECLTGSLNAQSPMRFNLGSRSLEVIDVLDRWLGPDHRYFKVQADDGDVYILRYDLEHARWELTLFSRRDYMGSGLNQQKPPATSAH